MFYSASLTRLGLTWRVALPVYVALIVLGTTLFFITANQISSNLRNELDIRLTGRVTALKLICRNAAVVGDIASIEEALNSQAKFADTAQVTFIDTYHHAISRLGQLPELGAPSWYVSWLNIGVFKASRPLEIAGHQYGSVEVTLSSNRGLNDAWEDTETVGLVVFFSLLITAIAISLILNFNLRPLKQLILFARAISEGNLSKRVGLSGSPEFIEVIQAFNTMADSLDTTLSNLQAKTEEIKNLAFYDPLTRLPNRRLLQDRLQQALASCGRSRKGGAVLFIDLDNFKNLNDTMGHDIGDLLLKQVATRLTGCVREGDTVARLGGDEFVIILENLSENNAEAVEQIECAGIKILAALNQSYKLGSHTHRCTSSLGVTLFGKHQYSDELLKQADIAMYQAKKAGRNTLRFFDPEMQTIINTRTAIEAELREALTRQQFQAYYQIQVDSANRPIGAEALIRWVHPERGVVSPANFIPLAEETGLILPIGQWMMDSACAQLKLWEGDKAATELVLAVNVSARQFHQADFVTQVNTAIARHAINPGRLKLELTESLLLGDIQRTIATMNGLNEIGVRLSLDDFGTGYSSLQYLKKLPISQLKIDQSFVHDISTDPGDATIVGTIIAMTKELGLEVIAEGVETEAQLEFLKLRGCHAFQGYLFGKPVPIAEIEVLLKTPGTDRL